MVSTLFWVWIRTDRQTNKRTSRQTRKQAGAWAGRQAGKQTIRLYPQTNFCSHLRPPSPWGTRRLWKVCSIIRINPCASFYPCILQCILCHRFTIALPSTLYPVCSFLPRFYWLQCCCKILLLISRHIKKHFTWEGCCILFNTLSQNESHAQTYIGIALKASKA